MPRRKEPHPLALQIGTRIRALRAEIPLTMEKLAYESGLQSKSSLSNIENGWVLPTLETLVILAQRLGVELVDLVTFPQNSLRHRAIDATRTATVQELELMCSVHEHISNS